MSAVSAASSIDLKYWGSGESRPLTVVYRPKQIMPSWLEATQAVIRSSSAVGFVAPTESDRWLTEDVANAASDFFAETADLLPGEPHVYKSTEGDLVADFVTPNGKLTSIISPVFVLLFASSGNMKVSKRIEQYSQLRFELSQIVRPLLTAHHGSVDTSQ